MLKISYRRCHQNWNIFTRIFGARKRPSQSTKIYRLNHQIPKDLKLLISKQSNGFIFRKILAKITPKREYSSEQQKLQCAHRKAPSQAPQQITIEFFSSFFSLRDFYAPLCCSINTLRVIVRFYSLYSPKWLQQQPRLDKV